MFSVIAVTAVLPSRVGALQFGWHHLDWHGCWHEEGQLAKVFVWLNALPNSENILWKKTYQMLLEVPGRGSSVWREGQETPPEYAHIEVK